jgi:hypothetical protein
MRKKNLRYDYSFAEWCQIFENCATIKELIDLCFRINQDVIRCPEVDVQINSDHVQKAACLIIDKKVSHE